MPTFRAPLPAAAEFAASAALDTSHDKGYPEKLKNNSRALLDRILDRT